MIQRIQSIWLLLASACAFAGLKIAFYTGNVIPETNAVPGVNYYEVVNGMSSLISNILTIIIAVLALVSIFLFSNRKLQIKFCLLTIFLEISLISYYWFSIKIFKEGTFSLGSILQLLILVLLVLAIRGIKRDDNIVAESNRLR